MATDPQRIILARHGVTDFTAAGRWDGKGGANPHLNETGRAQAEDLAERYLSYWGGDPVRVVTSTLHRTQETAAPIVAALGATPKADAAWDELGFGEWDGRLGSELLADHPDQVERFMHDETFRMPGGESHLDLHTRVRPAFQSLVDSGETTLVVAHWGPIMSVLSLLLGIDLRPARQLALAPTSLTSIRIGPQGPIVEFINDLGTRGITH